MEDFGVLYGKNIEVVILRETWKRQWTARPYLIAHLPTFYLSSMAVIFIGCFGPVLVGWGD